MNIRELDAVDEGYALTAWQNAHKRSPGCRRAPWWAYRREYGDLLTRLVNDPSTRMLGASGGDGLLGFLVATPGKRVHTLHWCQVKQKLAGVRVKRRREIFFDLLSAAQLGRQFVYTLQGPRVRKETGARSLDELLVADLRERGITATYVSMKEWLK